MIVVRDRRLNQMNGNAIPHVKISHMKSPAVHAGFVTDLPTC